MAVKNASPATPGIPKFLRLLTRHREAISLLSDEEAGALLKMMMTYAGAGYAGKKPGDSDATDRVRLAFAFLRPDIDEQIMHELRVSEKRTAAAEKRWSGK